MTMGSWLGSTPRPSPRIYFTPQWYVATGTLQSATDRDVWAPVAEISFTPKASSGHE